MAIFYLEKLYLYNNCKKLKAELKKTIKAKLKKTITKKYAFYYALLHLNLSLLLLFLGYLLTLLLLDLNLNNLLDLILYLSH